MNRRDESGVTLLRTLRALRSRWWVVVLTGLLGAGVALGAAEWRNRSIEPVFEAVAPVSVLRLPEESDDRFERRVDTIVSQARSAVSSDLAPDSEIVAGESGGTVEFRVTAPTSDEALSTATALRSAYLEARPSETGEQQLAPILDALAAEIALVESELAELRQGSGTSDAVSEALRSALQSELMSAAQEAVSLRSRLLDPNLSDEERATAEARLNAVEEILASIESRLEAIPAPAAPPESPNRRLDILVLERRLSDLESQYVAAALRESEEGSEGLVGEPFVTDRTSDEYSPVLATVAGGLVGILLGGVGVTASDRINRPIRSGADVTGISMVPVRRRPSRSGGGFDWYAASSTDPRRADIQTLRASVDRVMEHGGVVTVGGVDDNARDSRDIAVDLSASIAATGRSVLFLDTQFGEAVHSSVGGASLSEMVRSQVGNVPDRSIVKRLLWDRPEETPGLLVVPAGSPAEDPIDSLAGPAFDMVIEEARDVVDVVVVSTGHGSSPIADTVASEAALAVLVAKKDRTRSVDMRAAADRARDSGAGSALGVVIETGGTGSRTGRQSRHPVEHQRRLGPRQDHA